MSEKSGTKVAGEKTVWLDSARLYLSRHCPHCQKVWENIKQVRRNFKRAGFTVVVKFIEEDGQEFWAHGFDAVPTLVLPLQRPFKAIAPDWLIDSEMSFKVLSGDVTPREVLHGTAQKRIVGGVSRNENIEKFRVK